MNHRTEQQMYDYFRTQPWPPCEDFENKSLLRGTKGVNAKLVSNLCLLKRTFMADNNKQSKQTAGAWKLNQTTSITHIWQSWLALTSPKYDRIASFLGICKINFSISNFQPLFVCVKMWCGFHSQWPIWETNFLNVFLSRFLRALRR